MLGEWKLVDLDGDATVEVVLHPRRRRKDKSSDGVTRSRAMNGWGQGDWQSLKFGEQLDVFRASARIVKGNHRRY